MGNILSNRLGEQKVPNNTSFNKNINDLLLELDLYSLDSSTGSTKIGSTQKNSANPTGGPRKITINGNPIFQTEVDFSLAGLNNRPKNSAGQYIDINGIPYTLNKSDNPFSGEIYVDKNVADLGRLNKSEPTFLKSNKYYNFKRGFCNAQKDIPVNMVGVAIPDASTQLDNCLKFGTTTVGTAKPIPDISSTDTLNTAGTGLTSQTVYGQTLSSECSTILNSTLTNSYVNANLDKYSKIPSGTPIDLGSTLFQENPDGTIKFINGQPNSASGGIQYFTSQRTSLGDITGNAKVSDSCGNFYEDLCDHYYKHDFIDGINQNSILKNYVSNVNKSANFTNNLQFLSRHIPDCTCINAIPSRDNDPLSTSSVSNQAKSSAGGLIPVEYYWVAGGACGVTASNKQFSSSTDSRFTFEESTLFNMAASTVPVTGFAKQRDPINTNTGMAGTGGNYFIYAKNGRTQQANFNTQICNITQINNISNVGGGVAISGVNLSCVNEIKQTINTGSPAPPAGSPAPPAPPAGSPAPPAPPASSPAPSGNGPTISSFNVSYTLPGTTTIKDIKDITIPIDPYESLNATLTFPSTTVIPSNFYYMPPGSTTYRPTYGFGFILASLGLQGTNTPSNFKMGTFICETGTIQPKCANNTAGPMNIKIQAPFIYGTTTNEYGSNHMIYFMSDPNSNANKLTITQANGYGPILLKQYGMQITNVIPGKTAASVLYLQFNIKFNSINTSFLLKYAIVLTPKDTTKPTLTLYNTDFFGDAKKNAGADPSSQSFDKNADGSLTIGNVSGTTILTTTEYTYQIILDPIITSAAGVNTYTPGNVMYYSSNVPSAISASGSTMNFSTLISRFVSMSVGFLDPNNYNQFTLFPSGTATYQYGSTIIIDWLFSNNDKYTGIDFYYTYSGLTTPIKINNTALGINVNTLSFPAPPFANATTISIYAQTSGGSATAIKSSTNFPISLTSAAAPVSFKTMSILPNVKITTPTALDASISTATLLGYDITTNKINYTTLPATTSGVTTSATNHIVMQINDSKNKTLTASLTDSTSKAIAANATIQIGAVININWVLSTPYPVPVEIQVSLFGVIYDIITTAANTTSGTYKLTLYDFNGSLSTQSTSLILNVFGSNVAVRSAPINLTVTNPLLTYTTLPAGNILTSNPTTPFTCITNNTAGSSIINNITIKSSKPNDNIYFNVLKGFNSPTAINTNIISLKSVDFTKPLVVNYTASSATSFTNVYDNIRKKIKNIETFSDNKLIEGLSTNQININTLRLDLSEASGFSTNLMLNYIFNNYSTVYIQNLELFFDTTKIDNAVFNISLIGTPVAGNNLKNSGSPINIKVSTVRFIGILNSKVYVPVTIPGASMFIYSPNITNSDGTWAKSFILNGNNGYYSISPADMSAVQSSNNSASSGLSVLPAPTASISGSTPNEETGGTNWMLIGIVIAVLLILAAGVYFMFFTKKK